MPKGIPRAPTLKEWLARKPSDEEIEKQRMSLAEYVVEEGLEGSFPKPGIELWREVYPILTRRTYWWRKVRAHEIKYQGGMAYKCLIDNLRNTLRSNEHMNRYIDLYKKELNDQYGEEDGEEGEEEQEEAEKDNTSYLDNSPTFAA